MGNAFVLDSLGYLISRRMELIFTSDMNNGMNNDGGWIIRKQKEEYQSKKTVSSQLSPVWLNNKLSAIASLQPYESLKPNERAYSLLILF